MKSKHKKIIENLKFKTSFLQVRSAKRDVHKLGFTLVELILYMGILSVLVLVLTDILVAIFNAQLSSQSTTSVSADGRYIYSRITYDINRAQGVALPTNLGDSSATLVATISGSTYTYGLSSGNLQVNDGTGSYVLNGPDTTVSNLQFTRIGNINGKHTFRLNYTITGKIPLNGRIDSEVFQTTAGLR